MGILNSKQDDIDRAQYIRQKQINNTLQANLNTRTSQLKYKEEEVTKLHKEIRTHIASASSLQSIVEHELIQKENLQKDIQHLQETNQGLTNDKHLLIEELAHKQQNLDTFRKRNMQLVEAIKSVDSTIDALSEVTMREST
tara:strand:+ start:54 stop:476 length:423 start_codon:yes stop_codon:yes gene_type:complete